MTYHRLFLKVFIALLALVFLSLYLAEGAIYGFMNRVIDEFIDPQSVVSESIILAWATLYVALCGLALPTPAELPLIFTAKVNLTLIVLASAVGKSIGSTILFVVCTTGLKIGNHDATSFCRSLNDGMAGRLFKGSHFGIIYALCQAIPFAPMRSATVAYSIVSPLTLRTASIVVIGSFFGTVSRMLIIGGLAKVGISILTQAGILN